MATSIITGAFSPWMAERVAAGRPVTPDTMVFAYIRAQDENAAISSDEGMPSPEEIMHRCDITASGTLNENAVVYSAVLDTTVGDWDYNWVGLADSETETVLMIVHCATQRKIRTGNGVQGNSLIRNLVMEFAGAAELTGITVTPESWQIDYSARHAGGDERARLENIDVYGVAAFQGDGFLVTAGDGHLRVAPGLGYVFGLRCEASEVQRLPVGSTHTRVWIDASWQGTATGAWQVVYTLQQAETLAHYERDGFMHYVFAIAEIDASGRVTDLRPPFPLQQLQQQVDRDYLRTDAFLAEIAEAGSEAQKQARDHLDIPSREEVRELCPYRKGDVLLTTNPLNPAQTWPGTEWLDMSGEYESRTLMIGKEPLKTGGSDEVSLQERHLAKHSHDITQLRTRPAGDHRHRYDRYQKDGTRDSTRVSVDNTRLGIETADTEPAGEHEHTLEGELGSTGNGEAFSVVSRFVTLRGWLRTA
ncbi:TPA: phage tail protein [Klebsiella pneumoniae]|nr:phage tail protein [Klebsiella pneumoniae]HDY4998466.1 phage tail protein [Klebsiella pneumoniae]